MKRFYFKYIAALLLFGSNGIVASFIHMDSYEIVLLRTLLGSLLLLAIFGISRRKFTFFHYKKSFIFLVISGVAMGVSWILLYEAYARIGVGICGYLEPLSAVLFSALILKETMLPVQIAGAVLILGGTCLGECGDFCRTGKVSGRQHEAWLPEEICGGKSLL